MHNHELHRRWRPDDDLLAAVRACCNPIYAENDRESAQIFFIEPPEGWAHQWADPMSVLGPPLLAEIEAFTGARYRTVHYQRYRDGSGCQWHADVAIDVQAILSLGVTRTCGLRPLDGEPTWVQVNHGDLMFMPSGFQLGWEHTIPIEDDVVGERLSLVFRSDG